MYWDRTSFVIDPEGRLRKIYLKVNPEGLEQVLLNDIRKFNRLSEHFVNKGILGHLTE